MAAQGELAAYGTNPGPVPLDAVLLRGWSVELNSTLGTKLTSPPTHDRHPI